MERPSLVSLGIMLAAARDRFPLESYWCHRKSGDVYQIMDHTIGEATGDVHLTYRPVKFDNEPHIKGQTHLSTIRFNRPMAEFLELVPISPDHTASRFTRVRREWIPTNE